MKMKKITKQILALALVAAVAAPAATALASSSPSNAGSSSDASSTSSSSSSGISAAIAGSTSGTTPASQTEAAVDDNSAGDVEAATTNANGTAAVKAVANEESVKISGTVTVNGVTYKVTTIGANAFAGADEVEKVTINKNITKFNSKAFTGATSLKTIKLNTTKKVTVNVNAFKGLKGQTITIKYSKKMSAKNAKSLEKQFKAAAKKAGVKIKFKKA